MLLLVEVVVRVGNRGGYAGPCRGGALPWGWLTGCSRGGVVVIVGVMSAVSVVRVCDRGEGAGMGAVVGLDWGVRVRG